eukprot:TRINITY_DN66769_c4_g6_i1.p1 TRINITY_DN66769_c4_g6~~TRINITY_DN66769_c4_g6_i1.p1  ORF type:complete len:284 (+),score=4.93 TRINITY_DN66769_c4_g6_i1:36-887(+)
MGSRIGRPSKAVLSVGSPNPPKTPPIENEIKKRSAAKDNEVSRTEEPLRCSYIMFDKWRGGFASCLLGSFCASVVLPSGTSTLSSLFTSFYCTVLSCRRKQTGAKNSAHYHVPYDVWGCIWSYWTAECFGYSSDQKKCVRVAPLTMLDMFTLCDLTSFWCSLDHQRQYDDDPFAWGWGCRVHNHSDDNNEANSFEYWPNRGCCRMGVKGSAPEEAKYCFRIMFAGLEEAIVKGEPAKPGKTFTAFPRCTYGHRCKSTDFEETTYLFGSGIPTCSYHTFHLGDC